MKKRTWLLVLLAVACLAFDFLPRWGAPAFTYEGSSVGRYVWNLGWPRTWFVTDDMLGMQVNGKTPYVMMGVQVVLLVPETEASTEPVSVPPPAAPGTPGGQP
jgi:hypothetical protein